MSIEALKWAFEQEDVAPGPRFVLVALANRADEVGFCFPSVRWVQKKTGYVDSSIRKYLEDLEAIGKLQKTTRRREDGGKASSEYRLALDQPGLTLTPPSPSHGDTPPSRGGTHRRGAAEVPPSGGGHIRKQQTKASKKLLSLVAELPDWLPLADWEAFLADRKERKKPMTSRAQVMAIAKLDALRAEGHDPATLLRLAIERGWSGIFPPGKGDQAPTTVAEQNRKAVEEFMRGQESRP